MSAKKIQIHTQGNSANPVLLFLHAFPFSAGMWKDQMDHFSDKYFCVAADLPGFGKSALPDHAVTFEYYVDSVLDYLKESKIEKSVWCGLSMGGYLALRMYEKAPELCEALVLCDTKAGADGNEAKIKRAGAINALIKNRSEFVEAQWKALVGDSSQKNGDLKNKIEELISGVSDQGIAAGLVAMATRTDSTEGLGKIQVPTLILVGEEDKVTPIADSLTLAKSIPEAGLKILAKVGHLSNLENPQNFNGELSSFLVLLNKSL